MTISLIVHPGVDSAFLAWRAQFIRDCRGFALRRRIRRAQGSAPSPNSVGATDDQGFRVEVVASWVGFVDGPNVPPGTRRPTTEWPIQKYLWSDFAVNPSDEVAYRVTPMVGSKTAMTEAEDQGSDWSEPVTIGAETQGQVACFFNRGIVASQWLARLLPEHSPSTTLANAIADPTSGTRRFLGGPIRDKLVSLLKDASSTGSHVYAALFELDDQELVLLLEAFGNRAHVVLGNGSVKRKGDDENAEARGALAGCDLRDRMTAPRALARNKFLVLCDADRQPQAVWTGSTNWTKNGLCTQANNAVLARNPTLARFYLDQWEALAAAGDASPEALYASDAVARTTPDAKNTTLWFTPMRDGADLEQAGALIAAARDGILFLMFNPGPRGTLLNDIIELASPASPNFRPDLYVPGRGQPEPGHGQQPRGPVQPRRSDRRQRRRRPARGHPRPVEVLGEGTP